MYEITRKIHLYAGLAILTFVVMYFLTGYLMIKHDLLPEDKPVKKTVVERLDQDLPEMSNQEFSVYLQDRFDLKGKRNVPGRPRKDGTWRFTYYRPGFTSVAVVSSDGKEVEITTTAQGARGVIIGLHRLHGYGGGWLYDIWAFMYDLASLALIVFPVSGFILWFRTSRRKLAGSLVLACGFSVPAAIVLYLMYA